MRSTRLIFVVLSLTLAMTVIGVMATAVSRSLALTEDISSTQWQDEPANQLLGGGIIMTKTVGTDPAVCATTDQITVMAGTEVYYCYSVSNNSTLTFTYHTIEDSDLGIVLNQLPYTLTPGASTFITVSAMPSESVSNTATWISENPASYSFFMGGCTFPDITATGTPLDLADDGEIDLTLPFQFPFYNRVTDQITVGNNGVIVLDFPGYYIPFYNEALPTSSLPHAIAPFWDDLDDETGNVYAGLYTYTLALENDLLALPSQITGPENALGTNNYYIVQWHERSHFPGPSPSTVTFAVGMLLNGQGLDGYIFFCYQDTTFGNPDWDHGASATIGLNSGGSIAEQFSFNTPHPEVEGGGIGFMPGGGGQALTAVDTAHVIVLTSNTFLPVILTPATP